MNEQIKTQIEKFQMGDFSGYEIFYNETVYTVNTMLNNILCDAAIAVQLIPSVYSKAYQRIHTLKDIQMFYYFLAEISNEEAINYLKQTAQYRQCIQV